MIKKMTFLVLSGALVFAACKKSKDEAAPATKTTLQKVQAKWSVVSLYTRDSSATMDKADTYKGIPSDYVDFRTDMKVYDYLEGKSYDTTGYKVTDSYVLMADADVPSGYDTMKIELLTDTSFVYHGKLLDSGGLYEVILSLKK